MRAKQQSGAGSPDFLWPICEGHVSGRRVEPRRAQYQYQPHTECFVKQICVSPISAKKSGVKSLHCHLSSPPPWAGQWSDEGPAPWRLHAQLSLAVTATGMIRYYFLLSKTAADAETWT